MARARWCFTVEIYEEAVGNAYPILVHNFYGQTKSEAHGYYKSHLRTDQFLNGCTQRGKWNGVTCYSRSFWTAL